MNLQLSKLIKQLSVVMGFFKKIANLCKSASLLSRAKANLKENVQNLQGGLQNVRKQNKFNHICLNFEVINYRINKSCSQRHNCPLQNLSLSKNLSLAIDPCNQRVKMQPLQSKSTQDNLNQFEGVYQPQQYKPQHKSQQTQEHQSISLQQNPLAYNQELFQQFPTTKSVKVHHNPQSLKRKEKLSIRRSQLKDPEQRRLRNRQRHQKAKEKLQKDLQGKTENQIREYLDKRKYQKELLKDKIKKAVEDQIGQAFLIDIAFQNRMNEKENKSLAIQVQLIMKSMKNMSIPPNIQLCGLQEGPVKSQLEIMHYEFWPLRQYSDSLDKVLKTEKFKNKNVYYLSPDAKQTVDNIGQNDVFIIGGLVDRTVIKNASLNRAEQLGIQARSLPIRQFMRQRSCLNLDHIIAIVCKFIEVQNWQEAFDYGAPKRWKRQQGQKPLNPLSSESQKYQSDCDKSEQEVQMRKQQKQQ